MKRSPWIGLVAAALWAACPTAADDGAMAYYDTSTGHIYLSGAGFNSFMLGSGSMGLTGPGPLTFLNGPFFDDSTPTDVRPAYIAQVFNLDGVPPVDRWDLGPIARPALLPGDLMFGYTLPGIEDLIPVEVIYETPPQPIPVVPVTFSTTCEATADALATGDGGDAPTGVPFDTGPNEATALMTAEGRVMEPVGEDLWIEHIYTAAGEGSISARTGDDGMTGEIAHYLRVDEAGGEAEASTSLWGGLHVGTAPGAAAGTPLTLVLGALATGAPGPWQLELWTADPVADPEAALLARLAHDGPSGEEIAVSAGQDLYVTFASQVASPQLAQGGVAVTLIALPEPCASALLAAGVVALLRRRRR